MYKEYVKIGDKIKCSRDGKYYKVFDTNHFYIVLLPIEKERIYSLNIGYDEISELWRTIANHKDYEISACGDRKSVV